VIDEMSGVFSMSTTGVHHRRRIADERDRRRSTAVGQMRLTAVGQMRLMIITHQIRRMGMLLLETEKKKK